MGQTGKRWSVRCACAYRDNEQSSCNHRGRIERQKQCDRQARNDYIVSKQCPPDEPRGPQ